MKELYTEAVEEFHKHEDGKMIERITVALAPLADMHTDLWVEAYMLGYANGVKRGAERSWKATWKEVQA